MKAEFAEDVGHYWRTSSNSPGDLLQKAAREIESAGGTVYVHAQGRSGDGRWAMMLEFELDGERFRLVWPALPTRSGRTQTQRIKAEADAVRQAATALYYHVKDAIVTSRLVGARQAFFAYLMLPGGRTAGEMADADLVRALPAALGGLPQLTEGEG